MQRANNRSARGGMSASSLYAPKYAMRNAQPSTASPNVIQRVRSSEPQAPRTPAKAKPRRKTPKYRAWLYQSPMSAWLAGNLGANPKRIAHRYASGQNKIPTPDKRRSASRRNQGMMGGAIRTAM